MPGAGKTAIGSALARRLGVEFHDSDHEITQASNMAIPEIFSQFGETFFREKESQVIARLLAGTPCILSTGGGAFLQPENRTQISKTGVSIWLNVDLDILWDRVRGRNTRPLLQTADPYATLSDLYDERAPIYSKADLQVNVQTKISIDAMVERVLSTLYGKLGVAKKTHR